VGTGLRPVQTYCGFSTKRPAIPSRLPGMLSLHPGRLYQAMIAPVANVIANVIAAITIRS